MKKTSQLLLLASALFTVCMTSSSTAQTLVGRWQFLEGSGSTTIDSVTSTSGDLIGGAAFGTILNPFGGTNGTINFSAAGQYVDTNVLASNINATQSYSISMWVNYTAASAATTVALGNSNPAFGTAEIRLAPNVALTRLESANIGITPPYVVSGWSYIGPNAWTNLVFVHDQSASSFDFYVDGSPVGPITYTGTPTTTLAGEWFFNGLYGGSTYDMVGHIYDVQIYQGALTSTQINDVIRLGGAVQAVPEPSTAGLMAMGLAAAIFWRKRRAR